MVEDGVRALTLDLDLGEQRERASVLLAHKGLDFRRGARLLRAVLVARESPNVEALRPVFLVQCLVFLVVRICEFSHRCHIGLSNE